MKRRIVSGTMLTLLVLGILTMAFHVQPAKAIGTVYIRADGSVDPPTAPIQQSGDVYTLTDNITSDADGVFIQKSHISLDGAGFTLRGTGGTGRGVVFGDVVTHNVTVLNMNVNNFKDGIVCGHALNNTISRNNITGTTGYGIYLSGLYPSTNAPSVYNNFSDNVIAANGGYGVFLYWYSDSNVISGNTITTSNTGIAVLDRCHNNVLSGNNVSVNNVGIEIGYSDTGNIVSENRVATNNLRGIYIHETSNEHVTGNIIMANSGEGLKLWYFGYGTVSENVIATNNCGVWLSMSLNNTIVHNSFLNNIQQADNISPDNANSWDDGYPSGGNYWSDYDGTDLHNGPYQNLTGGDGVGDAPYIVDTQNQDRYPLMYPYNPRPWDLTGPVIWVPDGKCDIRDLALAAMLYGSVAGDGRYDRRVDITGPTYLVPDLKVDIRDLAMIAKHFGETYP